MNTGKTKIKHIEHNFQIDVGAPTPTILSNELEVFLTFYTQNFDPNWDGSIVHLRNSDDVGVVTIKFKHYAQFKFGSPNDEAIEGHPLFQHGLEPYSIQEIIKSPWIDSLIKMNSVHPNHNDLLFKDFKHYVFFFHDSCFEIVCKQYDICNQTNMSLKEEIKRISTMI